LPGHHPLILAELDKTRPGAAASPREGLQETVTGPPLGAGRPFDRAWRSTNPIESMISIRRHYARCCAGGTVH
jgi:putative transposase